MTSTGDVLIAFGGRCIVLAERGRPARNPLRCGPPRAMLGTSMRASSMHLSSICFLFIAAAACSSTGNDSDSVGGIGGSSSTIGGSDASEDASGGADPRTSAVTSTLIAMGGGSSAATMRTTAGGGLGSGGTSNGGGNAKQSRNLPVAATPCTGACPTGPVEKCFSVGCPLGSCDESRFFAGDLCSEVYPAPVDKDFPFCTAGQTGSYCFAVLDPVISYWLVRCTTGETSLEKCSGGCGVTSDDVAKCNGT